MLCKTRCCIGLMRPALTTALINLTQTQSERALRPMNCHLPHLRHKHETIFENLFEKPIDHSKVQIDEILKGFGDRGINRNGQEVSLQNMFKLFQLEDKFLVNEGKLHREMLKLQRALHPDKFLRTDAASRVVSDKLSALVNEAFETLKNPYKRALYMLRVRAGKTETEIEKSLDNLNMDSKFLSRMMDIREKIDRNQIDHQEKMKLGMELQSELDELILATNRDFERGDHDSVLSRLGAMKFLANCHAAVEERLGSYSKF